MFRPPTQSEREAIRQYVAKNFRREKIRRRFVVFILGLVLPLILLAIGWIGGAASGDAAATAFFASLAAGLAALFHMINYVSEGPGGDEQIKRDLVMRYRFQSMLGADLVRDLEIDENSDTPAKRKRRRLAEFDEDSEIGEVDLDASIAREIDEEAEHRRGGGTLSS